MVKNGKNIVCQICKDSFYVARYRFDTAHFCTKKCANKATSIRMKGMQNTLGFKHSQKTKEKISLICKGKKKPPRTREHRKNLGKANLGKKHSIETRLKMSEAHKGEKSYLWKGGITSEYIKIRGSLKYKLWREKVFERDNWTCLKCLKRGVKLNADHIKPFAFFPELRFKLLNGRTLCVNCHKKTNSFGKKTYEVST